MIRYSCLKCGAEMKSPDSLAGRLDKCPQCGYKSIVPWPRPIMRNFLIFAAVGLGAVLAVAVTLHLTSGTGPSAASDSPRSEAMPRNRPALLPNHATEEIQAKMAELLRSHGITDPDPNKSIRDIEICRKALAINPDFATAHVLMGYSYARLDRFAEGIEAFRRAISIQPDYAEAHCGMGHCLTRMMRFAEAIEAYEKAIDIEPNYAEAYACLGNCYGMLERYSESIQVYKKALSIKPDYAPGYMTMGTSYSRMGRYPEAIASYEQYLRLAPAGPLAEWVMKDLERLRRLAGDK